MLINADFSRRVTVSPLQYQWIASPQRGVERVMLDRIGGENARATSIVRYAANSTFPSHFHPGGEEIFVLTGTFSDEGEDFPMGWYMRNPPGSSHTPYSREGATIFVKLRQMPPHEEHHVRIDTRDPASWQRQNGRETCQLFSDVSEHVSLLRLAPHERLFANPVDGAELLVLGGELVMDGRIYELGSWMRLPVGDLADIVAGPLGVTVYLKTGHLPGGTSQA